MTELEKPRAEAAGTAGAVGVAETAEAVEAELIEDDLMISSASFEIDMSGIQRDIEELTEAIDNALTVYGEALAEPETIAAMGQADARRYERELSKAIRGADELRRKLNRDYRSPLDMAKKRYDELMGPVIKLHGEFKQRRIDFEEAERQQKRLDIAAMYERIAPWLALPSAEGGAPLVPFDRIFDAYGAKWLNKGTDPLTVESEIRAIETTIAAGERALDAAGLKHAVEARAVFWQTLDANAAIAHDRELCEAEQRQREREAQREAQRAEQQAASTIAASATTAAATVAPDKGERKPRVMLIDGATDEECRQIGAFCSSLGITGVFKGPKLYEAITAR